MNRTAVNIDMYFNMKDVPDEAGVPEEYKISKPYPQGDKLDSTCVEKLNNTSSMQDFLEWSENVNENNPSNEDTNNLQDILNRVSTSVSHAIYCRSFRDTQLWKASTIMTSLFEKQRGFGEYSDIAVFDFEREFEPITEQMKNFQGEFCLV